MKLKDYRTSGYWYPQAKREYQGMAVKIKPDVCPFCDNTGMVTDLKTDLPRPCAGWSAFHQSKAA